MKTNISVKIIFFPQIVAYTNFYKFLPEYFISGVLLIVPDLCFDLLALFEYVLRIKIKRKWENEDDLGLFLSGPYFMQNRIIIPMLLIMEVFLKSFSKRYIFQLTKYEHKDVNESIDFNDRKFSSMKPQQNFQFFTLEDFPSWHNVVTTLSQRRWRCHNVAWSKMSYVDNSFWHCDNVDVWRCQDVATMLLKHRHKIKHWISRPFYYGLFWFLSRHSSLREL